MMDNKLKKAKKKLHGTHENAEENQGRLTIKELRSCNGFETISELESNKIIESLYQLSLIAYNF